ncbi:MAG: ornithine cyclodeaminase family protein, partial [Candidatus Hodarchaeota archaeon]
KKLGIDVEPVDRVEEAIKDCDIIITATTSSRPVVKGKWLADGAHINAIGSYYPHARELDTETILKAKVVVDLKKAALEEAGDIIIPIKEGTITEHHIYAELGDIVAGKKTGRTKEEEVTVFKSVGLAIQDAAAAILAVRKSSAHYLNPVQNEHVT